MESGPSSSCKTVKRTCEGRRSQRPRVWQTERPEQQRQRRLWRWAERPGQENGPGPAAGVCTTLRQTGGQRQKDGHNKCVCGSGRLVRHCKNEGPQCAKIGFQEGVQHSRRGPPGVKQSLKALRVVNTMRHAYLAGLR